MSNLPDWLLGPDFSDEEEPQTPKPGNPLEVYNSRRMKQGKIDMSNIVKVNMEAAEAVEKGEVIIGGTK